MIRFRILDAAIALSGLRDLSLPLVDFQQLALDVDRVFVTENKVNGLCFPNVPCSIVVFGLGYGIQSLADITWLKDKPIVYWGDLDTHGFAMLSQLRGYYPQVRSILMDFETLLSNRALWGQEPKEKRSLQDLEHLSPEETVLFSQLRDDVHGERVRLEQERIPFHRLKKALAQDVPLSQ